MASANIGTIRSQGDGLGPQGDAFRSQVDGFGPQGDGFGQFHPGPCQMCQVPAAEAERLGGKAGMGLNLPAERTTMAP